MKPSINQAAAKSSRTGKAAHSAVPQADPSLTWAATRRPRMAAKYTASLRT